MSKSKYPISIKEAAVREQKPLSCPKCKDSLFIVYHEEVEVDTCPGCNGVWVDPFKEMTLLKKRPAGLSVEELRHLRKLYQPMGKVESVRYFPCPVCEQMMSRKNWGTHSGVIVDYCQNHGTWYDDQELPKVKEYVMLGGIEYEKHSQYDRQLSQTRRRVDHKAQRLEDKILHARIMNIIFGV